MAYGITYVPLATDFKNEETARNLRNIIDIFNKSEYNVKREEQLNSLTSSDLHNTYSINGNPSDIHTNGKLPKPSILDLEGKNPNYEYKKNLPPGARI